MCQVQNRNIKKTDKKIEIEKVENTGPLLDVSP